MKPLNEAETAKSASERETQVIGLKRNARDWREHLPRPVQKIELDARHTKVRLALALLFLIVGAALIVYSLSGGFAVQAGWAEIEASAGNASCAPDFIFLYPLGTTASPAAERKALTALYTEACEDAYRIFTNDREADASSKAASIGETGGAEAAIHNVRYLNDHPNEEIEIDAALYAAFTQIAQSKDRSLYLAPLYEIYDGMFYSDDPARTADFDPRQNERLREWFLKVCAYAADPAQVNLELLGENRARLAVSEEYLAFAREEEVGSFIDFYWMKNAFITDYLASRLTAGGYAAGTLSSFDGFMRNLDATRDTDYSLVLYERLDAGEAGADETDSGEWDVGEPGTDETRKVAPVAGRAGFEIRQAGVLHYRGARSMVCLRDYPLNESAGRYYCVLPDGEIRTPYLDARDGLCKSAVNDLTAYSESLGCADILLKLIPIYIAEEFQPELLDALAEDGIWSIYCQGDVLCHTQEAAEIQTPAA